MRSHCLEILVDLAFGTSRTQERPWVVLHVCNIEMLPSWGLDGLDIVEGLFLLASGILYGKTTQATYRTTPAHDLAIHRVILIPTLAVL